MNDSISVLCQGFVEASKQYTAYVAVGLSAALSALIIDWRLAPRYEAALRAFQNKEQPGDRELLEKPPSSDSIKIPGASVEVPLWTARLILVGLSFVAGWLAYNAVASMNAIAKNLATNSELLAALWMHPGIATGDAFIRYGAAVLPAFFVAIVAWRDGRRVQRISSDGHRATFALMFAVLMPYIMIVLKLYQLANTSSAVIP